MTTSGTHSDSHGSHGGEVIRLAHMLGITPESILDFSSNANSLCDDLTSSVLDAIPLSYQRYPDSSCTALRQRIALHQNTDCDRVLAGNGSSELIYLAFQALQPARVLMVAPIFSEYVKACEAFGIDYKLIKLRPEHGFDASADDLATIKETVANYRPDMCVVCAPNNPACTAYADIAQLIGVLQSKYILIDNSYLDFLWGTAQYTRHSTQAYEAYASPDSRIISLCSMTKFFYCTGIRLGYCHSDAETIRQIERYKTPWSVWEMAQMAGIVFLDRIDEYRNRLATMRTERQQFANALKECGAFRPDRIFEGANFVTAQLASHLRGEVIYQQLLQQGILVRLCDNIPGMPPDFIRMQARESAAWQRLVTALKTLAANSPA